MSRDLLFDVEQAILSELGPLLSADLAKSVAEKVVVQIQKSRGGGDS